MADRVVANRPPEVKAHAPRHPGADHHNAILDAARARMDELEPKLAAVLEPILRRAGDTAARKFRALATHHHSLHAAGPLTGVQPTSTMIAVRPRPEEALAIADPDGAPASDLHCTLAFLGEVEGPLDGIMDSIKPVAAAHGPLAGVVGGYGEFRPPGCGILLPDVPGLVELRCAVTEALVTAGIEYGRDHGFTAHITIDGSPEDGEIDYMLDRAAGAPLHFDALLLVRGDEDVVELPLIGPRPITAAGDPPPPTPDWTPPAGDELVDTDALAAAFRGKTDPIRLALIEDVLGAALGVPGVTEEEAIAYYHSPKAFELNAKLRAGEKLTAEEQHIVNALDAAMAPSQDDLVLWRGVPNSQDVLARPELPDPFGWETGGDTLYRGVHGANAAEAADASRAGAMGGGDYGKGIYLSRQPGHAVGYAKTSSGDTRGVVLRARLRDDARVATRDDLPKGIAQSKAADWARENGYDAYSPGNYVVVVNNDALEWDPEDYSTREVTARALFEQYPDYAREQYPDIFGPSSDVYETPGYTSVSETEETADQFAAGIAGPGDEPLVMRIEVPKGTPMLRIPPGDFGDQEEWLLPRDVAFKLGDSHVEDDPFGGQTRYMDATATSHGTLSSSDAGVARGAGLSFDVASPLIDGLLAKTGQHITGIADTTQANVMRAVGSAYDQGLTIPDTAKLITQVMHEAAGPRSVMIARTEMTSAVNGASLAAAQLIGQATGAKMTKTWLTAPGAQYPRHEEYDGLDGQTVGQDEPFEVGSDELQYPGDPDGSPEEVINCRCAMTYSDGSEVEAE